jgi:dihydrofolate synthase/folylpolyglutamate synthase
VRYTEALAYLDAHLNREAVAGRIEGLALDTITAQLAVMGDPHRAYPVVHVTGTNGKGSTAQLVSAVLEAHGLAVGLYTSPHLEGVNERIARNREPVDDTEFAAAIDAVARLEPVAGVTLSYFEILTAAAFGWFAEVAVDAAVVEVGLLGQFDATNVVHSEVAVVTNVGRDHTDGVGPWRRAVATEKAGIIKPGSHAVIGPVGDDVLDVFLARPARARSVFGPDIEVVENLPAVGGRLVDVRTPLGRYDEVFVPALGAHQGDNAALALAAAEAFFARPLDPDLVREAVAGVVVPGRVEVIGTDPTVVLDAAHNPEGAAALRRALGDLGAGGRVWVIGLLGGRDIDTMLDELGVVAADLLVACRPDSPRAVDPVEIARAARSRGVEAEVVAEVAEAVSVARGLAGPDDLVVVTGSTYVVGAARAARHR